MHALETQPLAQPAAQQTAHARSSALPARSVKAGMMAATPAATAAANGGRCTSCKLRSETSTDAYSRPAVTGP